MSWHPMWRAGATLIMLALANGGIAHAAPPDDAALVRQVIAASYDRPDLKVETAPVSILDDYAVAGWVQGPRGGRALLRKRHGQWHVVACAGDAFTRAAALRQAGMPAAAAAELARRVAEAERTTHPERLRRFALFGNAVVPVAADASHPHH